MKTTPSFTASALTTPPPGPPPPPGLKPPDPPPPPPPEPEEEEEEEEEEEGPRRIFIEMGRSVHDHWVWGRWEVDDELESYAFDDYTAIDSGDFEAIAGGQGYFFLTGQGDAAATVLHNGELVGLVGGCDINLEIGESILPDWSGSFWMDNGDEGDSLSFDASGNVQLDGSFDGTTTGHDLSIQGYIATTPDSESINGMIAGDNGEITGAFGWFELTFPEADIDGLFATDLIDSPQ